MTLLDITLNSLKRQLSKKLFLSLAMILSFTTVLTLYTFTKSQTRKIESQFDEYGANIIITPKSDSLSLSYGGISFNEVVAVNEIYLSDLEAIKNIQDYNSIRAVSPKLVGAIEVDTGKLKETVLIVGTDFKTEFEIKSWWENSFEIPTGTNDLIIGWDVKDKLNLEIEDKLYIKGEEFIVKKILKPAGNQDDSAIIAPYTATERLLDKKGMVSMVEISALCSECPIDDMVNQITNVLPTGNVRALQEVMVKRMMVVHQTEKFAFTISIILIVLCSLLIFSNITSSVNERRHEIGIYRAIGFNKGNIVSIIIGESFIVSIFSGIIGILVTIIGSNSLLPQFVNMEAKDIVIDYVFFVKAFIVLFIVGFVSSLFPSISASNSDPVETINSY